METANAVLFDAIALINLEGDLLDQGEFAAWLDLWQPEGLYVIPIDPQETDFKNSLNYAYDDHAMRAKRVHRLNSGESISTTPRARTLRTLSRFRLLEADEQVVVVRCAQSLWEHRKGSSRNYAADITYQLGRQGETWQIRQKVIRLINSDDALHTIGYIL
ncbi:aromatic-ring-hydroxylating dioxygenase subunit beta [Serratia aquatilis]|uniref:Aromatic-ring-hydroxylating dioxygenase subunit beta n=1 Tax=Serratia aquatilis TaxID=1737515 RepID=A0ABV6E996_9GAMM